MRGFFLVLLLILPGLAAAGPWPRESGRHFMASTALISRAGIHNSLWFERGLGAGRWLVLELRHATPGRDLALALRWHRALPDLGQWRLAWSMGAEIELSGQPAARQRPQVQAQLGFSLGRAVTRPWVGWTSLDLQVDLNMAAPRLKAELTLGYRPHERLALVLQGQALMQRRAAPALGLAGSVVWRWRPGWHLEFGLRHDLQARRSALRLGSWFEF